MNLEYSQVNHGGFAWLANREGINFLSAVEDWTPSGLSTHGHWSCWRKPLHTVYLAAEPDRKKYLIKLYSPKTIRRWLIPRTTNRARDEFFKTLLAHGKGIPTVLPVAVGESTAEKDWGLIIYPYLDTATTLERAYSPGSLGPLPIRQRQDLEKEVGALIRNCVHAGAYPLDAHLDHFLFTKAAAGRKTLVYYIDLERVKFNALLGKLFRGRRLVKTLGRLLARLEWLRVSGGKVTRPSMMRIVRSCLQSPGWGPSEKRLYRSIIKAARKYWIRREFQRRGPYPFRSIAP